MARKRWSVAPPFPSHSNIIFEKPMKYWHFCCSKSHFPYKMTITLLRMYLFKIWQIQKIEQVMPEVTVILPELETFKTFFKNTIYCKICMQPWIRKVSTPQNLNIFGFCQIQKIEQVYAVHNMTLPAPETFKIFFKNTIYWKKWKVACDLGFASYDINWTDGPEKDNKTKQTTPNKQNNTKNKQINKTILKTNK